MPHNRNTVLGQTAYKLDYIRACTLDFNSLRSVLNESARVFNTLFNRYMIRHKRHISHNKCAFNPARYCFCKHKHFIRADLRCGTVSQSHLGKRVADKNDIYSRFIKIFCRRVVIRSKRGYFLSLFFKINNFFFAVFFMKPTIF